MFKIALAQMAHPADGDVIAAARQQAQAAANASAQLLVFPECLMTPFEKTPEDFAASAQPLEGPFTQAMRQLAREFGLWVVFTMNEENSKGGAPYNTAVVVDDQGRLVNRYRKTHLYIAHGLDESQKMSFGKELFPPVETPFCTLGLGICYDLRFPEMARVAALAGADLLVFPTAWVKGPHKLNHWRTLLAARAIENDLFVAGCCRPDSNYVGHSLVADPLGNIIAEAGEGSELLVVEIDRDKVVSARDAMPCLEHRRPTLYQPLIAQ